MSHVILCSKVFGTDVMMTVATKVEAPVKFLYTAPPSDTPRSYPFSVLGLGDGKIMLHKCELSHSSKQHPFLTTIIAH